MYFSLLLLFPLRITVSDKLLVCKPGNVYCFLILTLLSHQKKLYIFFWPLFACRNTRIVLLFPPAVWLEDNHLSDCERQGYSPAVTLHSDNLLHKSTLSFSPPTYSSFVSQSVCLSCRFPLLHLVLWWRLPFITQPHLWGVSTLW